MSALRPAPLRCLVVAVALAAGALVGTGGVSGSVGAAEHGPRTQGEPAPETSVPVADEADEIGDVTFTDDEGTAAARRQADDDLRAVWMVVAGLVLVALGLLAMLIVYVRATRPARVAAGQDDRSTDDGQAPDDGGPEDQAPTEVVGPVAAPPPPAAPARPVSPGRPRRVEGPAKKLGTPDAERVLVRPGQVPIRVPAAPAAAGRPVTEDARDAPPPTTNDAAEEPGRGPVDEGR